MGLFFGTDGLRGIVNKDLTFSLAYKVGNALGSLCSGAKILVGRDTRISGSYLVSALSGGAMSAGADVIDVGVIPTAGVAYLTKTCEFDFGVVISASHNSGEYNGIKIFGKDGYKLSDREEESVERCFIHDKTNDYPNVGSYSVEPNMFKRYADFLTNSAKDLSGLKVVLDGANGASGRIAPAVFRSLNAKVVASCCSMDGKRINENCGSLYPQKLIARVNRYKADVGFAFDGDADRLIAVDENGSVIDGDMVLYILAKHLKSKGELNGNTVVGTSHTNMAIEEALKREGIGFLRTDIGDKYVLAKLVEQNLSLGGEQSGHVILKNISTTGDGILTAIAIASILAETGKRASELFDVKLYPQENVNVIVKDKLRIINNEELSCSVAKLQNALEGKGRLMVRASGTEPKIRIMVESPDAQINKRYAKIVQELVVKINSEE
ncbi:MAG: phosphoglucosamine mutase [Clostridia bacterium]|nr:phosphoglucosamine mutase [Clostridia bacterium]